MFKRPRLSAANRLVNALPMLALLFLASACGDTVETPGSTPPEQASDSDQTGFVLPAVWSTRDLGTEVASIGIAGELGSTIAVAFIDGGLQFLNLEGERITDKAALDAATLGDGRYLLLGGVPVTLFPGISTAGELKLYIHGGQLPEPIAYDLEANLSGPIAGLCTAPPETESDGVLRLAFWTQDAARVLHSGRIVQVSEELIFLADEPVTAAAAISACQLGETGATVFSAPVAAAATLSKRGHRYTTTLDTSGNFAFTDAQGQGDAISVRDGITVRMPMIATDMAGTGDTRGGGYPGGVLIVSGENASGDHRLVFIDPSKLTLAPFGYQAPAPR